MGIFTPDFTAVDASFPTYPKGMYQLKVTKRTPFLREKKDEEKGTVTQVAGVRYAFEVYGRFDPENNNELSEKGEDGRDIRGKPASAFTVYLHTEGGWQFAKPFLMAACGYNVKEEENEANAELFQAGDWGFSGEPGYTDEQLDEGLGDSWNLPIDRFVNVYMTINKRMNNGIMEDEQIYSSWSPVGEKVTAGV